MVNQVGTQNFFPDFNAESNQNQKQTASNTKEDSYEAALTKALEKRSEAKSQKYKLDKPKMGNKEPFFPEKAMPYHPDEQEQTQAREAVASSKTTSSQQLNATSLADSTKENNEVDNEQVVMLPELDGIDYEKFLEVYQAMQAAQNNQSMQQQPTAQDYQAALAKLMNSSYQSSSVNYPVSQIASESLDEETKNMLMSQGLWNMQPHFVAKPSPQLMAMLEMTEKTPVAKPVAQFMASMQSELGVQPDRLAQAMLNLPEGQIAQKPEETMKQVIENLDLNKKDEKIATQLYSKMIKEMNREAANLQPVVVPTPMKMQQNADVMNFANQNVMPATEKIVLPQSQAFNQKGFEQGLNQQSMNSEGFAEQELKSEIKNLDFKSDLNLHNNHQLQSGHQVGKHDALSAINNSGLTMTQLQPGAVPSAKAEAIANIINNAQALSYKGGGEMKLTLKPEHLGEIQLKVSMHGNNVDIQMIAEKAEAKKLIEQNISELKHGLSQHNLSMEKLDVSVGDKNTGNFNQGRQPDFNQAREFSQAFSQQQQARRDATGFEKANQAFKHRSMLKNSNVSDLTMKRTGASSGRLNVVA
ncbi:MAG: flagellar hook-length control protein FliK [Oligoflexia bacterium]|nr:flagellar hook-length control protein FliK [Oligoflexia bacterium]